LDAVHLACAEAVRADGFITCDDVLLKKSARIKDQLKVKVISLLSFINEEVFEV
jgi:predicted nucleic acid-binding protein